MSQFYEIELSLNFVKCVTHNVLLT